MSYKMNPIVKKKWLEALRSGKYLQGTGELRDVASHFCCLGVLCDIHSEEFKIGWTKFIGAVYGYSYYDERSVQPPDVSMWAWPEFGHGVPSVTINGKTETLDTHNDNGCTFEEIANAIEEQL